ncbi:MAG: alpha/beta hydrolase [Cyanobacteria bacterium P01_A01_bin.84]
MPLPTVILPGYLENASSYYLLEQSLQNLGFPTVTVPVNIGDWIGTLGKKGVSPILRLLSETVEKTTSTHESSQVNIIGHSAGGWIARIYLGDIPYLEDYSSNKTHLQVSTLVTLGTPHISQERWTRKSIDFVNLHYPGAFHPNINYVCIAGKTIFGKRRWGKWFAFSSYQQTCGNGNTWGDGITPVSAAHLKGAENLIIEGATHSPKSPDDWYGSPKYLNVWAKFLQ